MTYTPDQVASAIIAEGQTARTEGTPETLHGVITPRGIQIALATAIVESGDRVLANPNVPESESYPNDGDGYDHNSTGDLQQQPAWWGTVAEEMDPRLSAAMFYHALEGHPYNDLNTSPGTFAQAVQGSAFPARYDQHFQEAVDQYNRLVAQVGPTPPAPDAPPFTEIDDTQNNNNCQDRAGQRPRLFVLHTEEGAMLGEDLERWMAANEVSYHFIVDNDGTVVDMETDDVASWSVLDANNYSLNLVFAGSYVAWTRLDWLNNMGDGIKEAAWICARECHKWGVPPVIRVGNSASGYPSLATNDGVTDHYGITVGLHIGTHTDVGPGFPWDVFDSYLQQFYGNLQPTGDDLTPEQAQMLGDIHACLFNQIPSQSIYRQTNDPMWKLHELIKNDDGMTHQADVERFAIAGNEQELGWVVKVAAGEGLDTSAYAVDRAKAVLEQVPADTLKAFQTASAK